MLEEGPSTLDAVAAAIAAAPQTFALSNRASLGAVAFLDPDDALIHFASALWIGNVALPTATDLAIRRVRVSARAVPATELGVGPALRQFLDTWPPPDARIDLAPYHAQCQIYWFGSQNRFGDWPMWVVTLLRSGTTPNLAPPRGLFRDAATDLFGDTVGALAANWLRDPALRERTAPCPETEIIVPDHRARIRHIERDAQTLHIETEAAIDAPLMISVMDPDRQRLPGAVLHAVKGNAIDLPAQSFPGRVEMYLIGEDGSRYDYRVLDAEADWSDHSVVTPDTYAITDPFIAAPPSPTAPSRTRRRWGKWIAISDEPMQRPTGMSTVWRVRDTTASRPIVHVLKEMRFPDKKPSSTPYKRFVREVMTIASLARQHIGFIEVVDHNLRDSGMPETDEPPYYVMPHADLTLQRAAKHLKGKLEDALELMIPVADTVAIAHTSGVIHRDIKPANILLIGDEWRPVVCDFGTCYLVQEERVTSANAETVGTDEFVAPELRGGGRSDTVTPAADVYSLGKTLYATVAGGDVFPREWFSDPRFDLEKILGDPRLAHLRGLLKHMVTERPGDRLQSMADCAAVMRRAIENLRANIAFTEGMYGGSDTPAERAVRLATALNDLTGTKRRDVILEALRATDSAAKERAEAYEHSGRGLAAALGHRHLQGSAVAATCAEELLSSGLVFVQEDERDPFEEWLTRATYTITQHDGLQFAVHRQIGTAAGVLAAYGAAYLAWDRRRFDQLRIVVEAYASAPDQWSRHTILGGGVDQTEPWIVSALGDSAVFQRVIPSSAEDLAKTVPLVSAIAMLKQLASISAAALAAYVERPATARPFALFPASCPRAATWVNSLAEACLASPPIARDLAQVVFGISTADFTVLCRRLTPAIAVAMERESHGLTLWNGTEGATRWRRWCGGEAPPSPPHR